MGDGFGVDPQQIVDHAASLDTKVFERVRQAAAAVEQVGLGDSQAWGVMFEQLVPPFIGSVFEDGRTAMSNAADFNEALGEALEGTAVSYCLADESVTEDMQQIAGEIES